MKKIKIIVFGLTILLAAGAFLIISARAKTGSQAVPKTAAAKISTTTAAIATATPKAIIAKATAVKPAAKATAAKPAVKKAATAKPVATVKTAATARVVWTSAALKLVSRIPSGVRPAYKKKVESYALRNKIKTITPAVVNSLRE